MIKNLIFCLFSTNSTVTPDWTAAYICKKRKVAQRENIKKKKTQDEEMEMESDCRRAKAETKRLRKYREEGWGEVGSETPWQRDADGSAKGGLGKETDREAVVDRRGLFVFVEPTSFISSEQPPSAERLHDRNQSEGNRPYSSTEAATHRYRH